MTFDPPFCDCLMWDPWHQMHSNDCHRAPAKAPEPTIQQGEDNNEN